MSYEIFVPAKAYAISNNGNLYQADEQGKVSVWDGLDKQECIVAVSTKSKVDVLSGLLNFFTRSNDIGSSEYGLDQIRMTFKRTNDLSFTKAEEEIKNRVCKIMLDRFATQIENEGIIKQNSSSDYRYVVVFNLKKEFHNMWVGQSYDLEYKTLGISMYCDYGSNPVGYGDGSTYTVSGRLNGVINHWIYGHAASDDDINEYNSNEQANDFVKFLMDKYENEVIEFVKRNYKMTDVQWEKIL